MENVMRDKGFIPGELLGADDQVPVKQRMQDYIASRNEKREDRKFEKIKEKLFQDLINSNPELKQYYKDIKALKSTSAVDAPTDKQLLNEKRNVWRGAVAAEKSDKRNLIFNVGSGVVSGLGLIALSTAATGLLSVAGFALGAVSLLITLVKYKKKQRFNKADSTAKGRDYEKILEKFINAVEKYKEVIDANKDVIMQAQKNLSHSKFKKFMADFQADTFKDLGLDNFATAVELADTKSALPLENQINPKNTPNLNVDAEPEMEN